MESEKIRWTGTSPLIVHSDRLANPLDPLKKQISEITKKVKKTDEDWGAIFRLEWEGGLYYTDRPIMPSACVKAAIRSSAKLSKRGRHIQRGVMILENEIPIEYKGPTTLDKLWFSGDFSDIRSVVLQGKRVMRCRPIFREWAIEFNLLCNSEVLNMAELLQIIKTAGEIEGLCELRGQGFGRFDTEIIK